MKLNSLQDLMIEKLNDIYTAEKKTEDLLPKLANACSSEELKATLLEHVEQSKNQVTRLDQVFSSLNMKPKMTQNPVIDAMIEKTNEMLNSTGSPEVKDAALCAVEQGIEHYEIAAYGTARSFANSLGQTSVANLLQTTLDEEKYTDVKLSKIADKGYGGEALNKKAA